MRWTKYKKDNRLVELYNNCYLKLYLSGKLEKFDKAHVIFNETITTNYLAQIVEN